jgi:hypothetical protein
MKRITYKNLKPLLYKLSNEGGKALTLEEAKLIQESDYSRFTINPFHLLTPEEVRQLPPRKI